MLFLNYLHLKHLEMFKNEHSILCFKMHFLDIVSLICMKILQHYGFDFLIKGRP